MELAVALMLIFLGIRNLVGLFLPTRRDRVHKAHNHAHGDGILFHHHSQSDDFDSEDDRLGFLDCWFQRFRVYQMVRPLAIGIVHGLAGSAAVALLVLGTIPNARWAIAYLAVFGIGTVLGMMLITLTISSTFSYGQRHFAQIGRHFGLAAGGISLAFGAFIFYQIGFVNGLFTANATWIPR
jgi:high-affinity nickel-transport protein